MTEWKFADPPDLAVITTRAIVEGDDWIAYVCHDEDDGSWQFHRSKGLSSVGDAVVISFREIVMVDQTVNMLADLPRGWCAWRDARNSPWLREKIAERVKH